MFFVFFNRLGCLGSLLLSAAATVALVVLFGLLLLNTAFRTLLRRRPAGR